MQKKKRRGANSTRTHERHREAPLREARQAAPDGARASAALSSFNESSRFSRGPSRCDAKIWFVCYIITVLRRAASEILPPGIFDSKGAARDHNTEAIRIKIEEERSARGKLVNCGGLSVRSPIWFERSPQDALKCIVFTPRKVIQPKLNRARISAEAERTENSIPN